MSRIAKMRILLLSPCTINIKNLSHIIYWIYQKFIILVDSLLNYLRDYFLVMRKITTESETHQQLRYNMCGGQGHGSCHSPRNCQDCCSLICQLGQLTWEITTCCSWILNWKHSLYFKSAKKWQTTHYCKDCGEDQSHRHLEISYPSVDNLIGFHCWKISTILFYFSKRSSLALVYLLNATPCHHIFPFYICT